MALTMEMFCTYILFSSITYMLLQNHVMAITAITVNRCFEIILVFLSLIV